MWAQGEEERMDVEEYEYICSDCGQKFNNIRAQKYTIYDDDGEAIKTVWVRLCPVCGEIIEG